MTTVVALMLLLLYFYYTKVWCLDNQRAFYLFCSTCDITLTFPVRCLQLQPVFFNQLMLEKRCCIYLDCLIVCAIDFSQSNLPRWLVSGTADVTSITSKQLWTIWLFLSNSRLCSLFWLVVGQVLTGSQLSLLAAVTATLGVVDRIDYGN